MTAVEQDVAGAQPFRSEPTMVREDRIDGLRAAIAAIAKRAAKLGVAAPELILTGADQIRTRKLSGGREVSTRWVEVIVTGETPRFPGWQLVAVVSHEDDVVDVVPGEHCPRDQRDRGPICDHCGVRNARRKKTMVLRNHQDGRHVKIGTTCIGDFLGALKFNPELALNLATQLFRLVEDASADPDQDYEGGFGARVRPVAEIATILEWTGGWLQHNEWVSGARAREIDRPATRGAIADLIWPPIFTGRYAEENRREYREAKEKAQAAITDELRAEVRAAIAWIVEAADADPENDYLQNCATLVRSGWAVARRFGYVCSILPAYRRHVGRMTEAAESAPTVNEHVGQVGDKLVLDVTLVADVRVLEIDWGTSYLHKFRDAGGRLFVTFASTRLLGRRGDAAVIRATVKGHDERDGARQTKLTRVTVLASEGPALDAARELLRGDSARPADDAGMLALGTAVKFRKREKVWRLK